MPISRRKEQENERFFTMRMLDEDVSVEKVASIVHTTVRSVQRWRKAFKDFGEEGLTALQGAGRPPKVSPTQMSWVALTVKDDTPANWGLGFKLWTLPHIKKVIELGLGLSLCLPTVRKIMKHIGFTPQRPLRRAYEWTSRRSKCFRTIEILRCYRNQSKGSHDWD